MAYFLAWDINLIITTFITITITIIIIILFKITKTKTRNRGVVVNLPPGSYGWPIIGETLQLIRATDEGSPEKFISDRMEKYKTKVFKTSLLGESMAVLSGPADNKFLFSSENKLVTVWWPTSVRKLLGDCIATTGGVEAMHMRKMVSYFLSPDAFTKLYINTMCIVSNQHIKSYWEGKEELKVSPTIKLYAFEVACRSFMSIEDPVQIKKLGALLDIFLTGVISIPLDFPGTRFYRAKKATAAIKKELQLIVRKRREELEQRRAMPSQDLLSHLLVSPDENGVFMSESVIVNNLLMLLFSGHDSSSSATTLLIRSLAEHPQVYDQVLREQTEIASSKEDREFLQWEDIQKMKYSWNVLCETMRLWPPITKAFREALVDINYGGYHIPKGWKFYWNVLSTHTDSSLYPDNTKFDPSRFEGRGPIPYSYVPFGGGPRMCLGKEFARLEILVFLHNFIRKFRWDLVVPGEKIVYDPIPKPEKGLPIRLHPHKA